MRVKGSLSAIVLVWVVLCRAAVMQGAVVPLSDGWKIQAAAEVKEDGGVVSSSGMNVQNWADASVPSTVLGTLVKDGVYKDVFLGRNLEKIPAARFAGAWWYRTEFDAPKNGDDCAELVFDGINYRANVWLNGERIADADKTFGAYRTIHLDVTGKLKPQNVLAVEVFPPGGADPTVGFVDWNPAPADHNMGLFRPVSLHTYKTVGLDHLFVESKIDHADWSSAQLTVHADLSNQTDHPVNADVVATLGDVTVQEAFPLAPHEIKSVALIPENHAELKWPHAQLWWPWELGEPHLYSLHVAVKVDGAPADAKDSRFGIREVADYLTPEGYRGYTVNGKKILIRGGGWADDLFLMEDHDKLNAQLEYTRAMNLNTVRLEGVWGATQSLYDLADEKGMLVMVGWSCQWEWKDYIDKPDDDFGTMRSEADFALMTSYLHDQVLWLRQHPSIFVWVLGSDKLPRPELEKRYDALMSEIDPTRPRLKSCAAAKSNISGPTGVKMEGPYDYVTPNYWYLDKTHGGAYGFNTETGPGPQPPPLDSLRRMLPPESLWPINDDWNFHCGLHEFTTMKRYLDAFHARYGETGSVEEFSLKSQAANYEAIRPMFEAFAVNRSTTTGIVQWMLNASWPKMYWQLYDYYLNTGGSYFGTKRGAAPVAVIYNYGDHSVYLANQTPAPITGARVTAAVYDLNSHVIFSQAVQADCPPDSSHKLLNLGKLDSPTPVYFLDLAMTDAQGRPLAENFYWLSTKADVLDEGKSEWFVTPNKSFADFKALNELPPAQITVQMNHEPGGRDVTVTLANQTNSLAFFNEMRLVDATTGMQIAPILWDDNYVSLTPETQRTFHAKLIGRDVPAKLRVEVRGWNVRPISAEAP